MFFHMAEYCDTPQSKEGRNREHKACLNERAILRLLDHDVTWKSGGFPDSETCADWVLLLQRIAEKFEFMKSRVVKVCAKAGIERTQNH